MHPYGDQYRCDVPNAGQLAQLFEDLCRLNGIATCIPQYATPAATQLSLL